MTNTTPNFPTDGRRGEMDSDSRYPALEASRLTTTPLKIDVRKIILYNNFHTSQQNIQDIIKGSKSLSYLIKSYIIGNKLNMYMLFRGYMSITHFVSLHLILQYSLSVCSNRVYYNKTIVDIYVILFIR